MEKNIKDHILSKRNNKILAFIDVYKDSKIPFLYSGKIVQNNFPKELVLILDNYVNAVNDLTFSIFDEIKEEINMIYQIEFLQFGLSIKGMLRLLIYILILE